MRRRIWGVIPVGAVALLAMGALSAPHALANPTSARAGVVGFRCGDNVIDPTNGQAVDQNTKRIVYGKQIVNGATVSLETGKSPQYGQVFWVTIAGGPYRKFGMDWTSDTNPNFHRDVNWNFCGNSPDLSGRFQYTYAVEQVGKRWFRISAFDSYGNWESSYWFES